MDNSKWIINKEYCKKSFHKFDDKDQEIINRMSKDFEQLMKDGCVTTSTNEKLLKAVQDIYDSLPSFDLLDKMIEQGYNINQLVLIIYSQIPKQDILKTKHGALKVMGSPYADVKNAYLMPVPDYRYMKLEL